MKRKIREGADDCPGPLYSELDPLVQLFMLLDEIVREAEIFVRGLQAILKDTLSDPALILDIGGGSVQAGLGDDTRSYTLGTYTIEREYQRSAVLTKEEYRSIVDLSQSEFSGIAENHVGPVVFGSNCMAEFLCACCRELGLAHKHIPMFAIVERAVFERIAQAIVGEPYDSVGNLFPTSPKFMYGADKALAVVEGALRLCHSEKVVGTDHSLSTVLAENWLSRTAGSVSSFVASLN